MAYQNFMKTIFKFMVTQVGMSEHTNWIIKKLEAVQITTTVINPGHFLLNYICHN